MREKIANYFVIGMTVFVYIITALIGIAGFVLTWPGFVSMGHAAARIASFVFPITVEPIEIPLGVGVVIGVAFLIGQLIMSLVKGAFLKMSPSCISEGDFGMVYILFLIYAGIAFVIITPMITSKMLERLQVLSEQLLH